MKEILQKFENELFAENFECSNCSNERLQNDHHYLCDDCYGNIDWITFGCNKCGDNVNDYTLYCNNCKQTEHKFDRVFCCCKFEGVAKRMVYSLKYGEAKYIARTMAEFMAEMFLQRCNEKIDFIIPVPLSKQRMKSRGYNQAELLAKHLSDILNIPMNCCIARTKDTPTQTHLTREERKENLLDAFDCINKENLKDKNVLLVDDVFTTGATMNEITKVLKRCKVNSVYGITFCHA